MSTGFSEIRDFIRSAVMDLDANCYRYSDAILNAQIRLSILNLDESTYTEVSSETFNDLSNKEKAILVLQTAVHLVANIPDTFEHKSPVMQVKRKGISSVLLASLQARLDGLTSGSFFVESDTDFNALVKGPDRYINDIDNADRAFDGTATS